MNKISLFTFLILLICNSSLFAQIDSEAITGIWRIHSQKANIQIYELNDKYYGKIIQGNRKEKYDVNNSDSAKRKNLLVGTFILEDLNFDGENKWKGGTIYNPNNGKTYSCIVEYKNENTLKVTGYLGFSLFGKNQIWTRKPKQHKL